MRSTFEVASEVEMLALSAQIGDIAIRSDLMGTRFLLTGAPAATIANWLQGADPFRLRLLKAVSAQLKTITPANRYWHDLSDYTDSAGRTAERVFRGKTVFGDNDPLPALAILEDPRAKDSNNGSGSSPAAAGEFRVLVQGFVTDDKDHPLDPAYQLSAEVIQALVKSKADRYNVLGLGYQAPCVMSLSIGQPVHRPPDDDVSAVAYFLVGVTFTLAENLETPFA